MECHFLSGNYMKYCSESREVYVPSAFELEEYCTSSRYTLCPLFCRKQAAYPESWNLQPLTNDSAGPLEPYPE
jgi:hypothetical protein